MLTDVSVDWGNLAVEELMPRRTPDLFSSKPVVLSGRFSRPGEGQVILRGRLGGKPWERAVHVVLPREEAAHAVVDQLWARAKVQDLMNQDWLGIQRGEPSGKLKDEITRLGVGYRIMTQFTSFVAVEEMVITEGGQPRTVAVPVEMPEGVSHEGVFGEGAANKTSVSTMAPPAPVMARMTAAPPPGWGTSAAPQASGGMAATDSLEANEAAPSPRDARQIKVAGRVHPKLAAARTEAATRGWTSSFETDGIQVEKGRVRVWIWLEKGLDAGLRRKLEALGVKISGESGSGSMVVASLPLQRLEEIALLEGLRYLDPAR